MRYRDRGTGRRKWDDGSVHAPSRCGRLNVARQRDEGRQADQLADRRDACARQRRRSVEDQNDGGLDRLRGVLVCATLWIGDGDASEQGRKIHNAVRAASGDLALSGRVALVKQLDQSVADPFTAGAYPIPSFSWMFIYPVYKDRAKASALRDVCGMGTVAASPRHWRPAWILAAARGRDCIGQSRAWRTRQMTGVPSYTSRVSLRILDRRTQALRLSATFQRSSK